MKKKQILVLGAGRSAVVLISYLLDRAPSAGWHVVVGDRVQPAYITQIEEATCGEFVLFNLDDELSGKAIVQRADVVISLLPPQLHEAVAQWCLEAKRHLFTASYVSKKMRSMHDEARDKGLLFLNECGLDPGIDHMSIMRMLDRIREKGGKVIALKSFAGGLIAPETDIANPWRYKFTWNPQSVVKAGQGMARFLFEGRPRYISYSQLFRQPTPVHIPGHGDFVGYANRDSLKYVKRYGLEGIHTLLRGTLRTKGFCRAWNVFVQLGCTDDTVTLSHTENMTHRDFIEAFLPAQSWTEETVEERLCAWLSLDAAGPELKRIRWLGCFSDEKIGLPQGAPAQLLEHIINKKWKLQPEDKDMVVMWHQCRYALNGKQYEHCSKLIYKGEGGERTAMAKGVGLPLAMAATRFLEGRIADRGVCIPIEKNIYEPVLQALEDAGIRIQEEEKEIDVEA